MSKKKIITPQERKRKELSEKFELCLRPHRVEKTFVKSTRYMLHHEKYIKLSNTAKVALQYMMDWATNSESFWDTGKFEYSGSLLETIGIMSRQQAIRCFKELRESGFINAEYKNGAGAINRWSFSNRWYTGEPEPMPEVDNYKSAKNTTLFKSIRPKKER